VSGLQGSATAPVLGPDLQPVTGADVPTGTISDVLSWVDGDPARAQAALDVELAKSSPRVTLLDHLEHVIAGAK
jgi:hypothetical protein